MTPPTNALLDSTQTFSQPPFNTLDPRLLLSLADQTFAHPTLVQAKAIPLLLEGKDVLARARTGSGKTLAYCLPGVQKVLEAKAAISPASGDYQVTRVVVLVPTKELALQVTAFLKKLTSYCEGLVGICNVTSGGSSVQRVLLNDNPDIIVSTPTRLHALLQSKAINLSHLSFLAIDEADLLLSYGHKDDLTRIMDPSSGWIPRLGVQGCLMSATLGEDVEGVKGLVLRNPAILTLSEPATSSSLLTQHYTHSTERDKFLLIYVLLKLKLIRGKSIVFVNDVERGYRVKLFLEQFGVKTCVVNAELPLASRYHVVEEFNRGVYDVIVATDEISGGEERTEAKEGKTDEDGEKTEKKEDDVVDKEEEEMEDEDAKEPLADGAVENGLDGDKKENGQTPGGLLGNGAEGGEEVAAIETEITAGPSRPTKRPIPNSTQSRKRRRTDPASSLARGIDFTSASSVINFDLPTTSTAYMHRVGRTARAGHSGLALSFIVARSEWGKDKVVSLKSARNDEVVWERIKERVGEEGGGEMKEWDWGGRKGEVEGFRYRVDGALRAVTGKRVAEARREEVRRELLNSEKLKAHFAANPLDLNYLRHDAPLHPARTQSHLKHVPNYLMPKMTGIPIPSGGGDVGDGARVSFAKRGGRGRGRGGGRGGGGGRKKVDPLRFKG